MTEVSKDGFSESCNFIIAHPGKPPPARTTKDILIADFTAAAIELFNWYDGERSILRHNGYTCPTARGVHGMTMLRTAAIKAQRLSKK